MAQVIDIAVQWVRGHGYLPKLIVDGKEAYRGEFKQDHHEAIDKSKSRLADMILSGEIVVE